MDALLEHLYRYPVKGLSAEALSSVELTSGNTIPFDRRYAIENGPIGFDPAVPKYFKKPHFLMLMRDERMATLQSRFDARTCVLSLSHSGNEVATGNLETEVGRKHIEDFLQEYFAKELKGRPKILSAPDHSFCDVDMRVVSIINLATLNELSSTAGQYVHPLRFRANLYVSGWPSWHEFSRWPRDLGGRHQVEGGQTYYEMRGNERQSSDGRARHQHPRPDRSHIQTSRLRRLRRGRKRRSYSYWRPS